MLQIATQDLFKTALVAAANRLLVQPEELQKVAATISGVDTWPAVILPVAYSTLCILTAVQVVLVLICIYTERHSSILYEEPEDLSGAAAILRQSELMDRVAQIDANQCKGQIAKGFGLSRNAIMIWAFEEWDCPSKAKLISKQVGKRRAECQQEPQFALRCVIYSRSQQHA